MAIIFLGKSKCPLCNEILTQEDDIIGLPPISDTSNLLYEYFDCGFHKTCYENWNKRKEIESILSNEKTNFELSDYYKEMSLKFDKPE